jgi:hypothetical protein
MTDAGEVGTEWVPRWGLVGVPRERAELIRGLFELAAWVADHPELPVPAVRALVWPRSGGGVAADCGQVDRAAAALEVEAAWRNGQYVAERYLGPVEVTSFVISTATRSAHVALMSYSDNVQPQTTGGAR